MTALKRSVTVLAATVAMCVGEAVPVDAAHSATAQFTRAQTSTRLAAGVNLRHTTFNLNGSKSRPERVVLLSIILSATTSLVAATPDNVIGAPRATVVSMARQEKAIAGINGDFFYLSDPTAVPRGGLTHLGVTLKSALSDKRAALYVTAAGTAAIGDPGFEARVTAANARGYPARSINSLENAKNGSLTIVDRNVLSADLPGCTIARLAATATGGQYTVRSLTRGARRFSRPATRTRALVTCGSAATRWLTGNLAVGKRVQLTAGYTVPHIRTLLSGGRLLIRSGKRFNDKDGLLGYGNQRKPETFACVKRDGRHVLLGVVDGDAPGVTGMTYAELTTFLRGRGCWSAMTLDGSGSSTLVAKRPHHRLAIENHPTNHGGPRRVVDGLFVVHS